TVELRLEAQEDLSENFASGLWKIYLWDDEGGNDTIEINISQIFDPVIITKNWSLLGADGSKTVWLKVVDRAGNWAIINATIFLDRVKPANISIDMAQYTNSTSIPLTISANDPGYPTGGSGIYQMCFSEDGINWGAWINGVWTPNGWVSYSSSYTYKLRDTLDSPKTIYLKVGDRAGNEAIISTQITLDRTLPEFILVIQLPADLNEDSTYVNITVTIAEDNLGGIIPIFIYRIGNETEESQMMLLTGKTFYLNLTEIDFNASQDKNIYYRIRCSDLAGNINTSTECSEYVSPIPDMPELTTPCDYVIITTNTTTLTWAKNSTDPDWYFVGYRVVVEYYNENLTFVELLNETVSVPELALYNLAHNITYYWRVQAINGSAKSKFSERWQFIVKLPDLSITQTDITFYPANTVPVDTQITINITVWNLGESDAENVVVRFYKYHPDEPRTWLLGSIMINVKKGESANASFHYPYQLSMEEKFRIYVFVDPDNVLDEVREDNNLDYNLLEVVDRLDVLPINVTFSVNGVEPSYIFENDDVIITAEIINQGGDIKIPFWVEFWFGDFENNTFNGSFIGKVQIEEILTGKTRAVSINWKAEVGHYKIWVFLNTTNLPNENIENNWYNKTFRVLPPTAIEFQVSVSLLTTDPSGTLSYIITITNIGQISDTYNLTVEDLPSGWDYSFIYNGNEIENVTLETGETIEILLKVKSSDKPGTYNFRVVAYSQKDIRAVYDAELTAKIKEPFPWYLVIIAIIAAAVIAAIGLMVKKGVIVVKEKPERVKIEPGYNYL
ncbi:MAG: hypothetical protein L6265_10090, partial [Thermoplasmatales archaeon]|nr:hypothetical protein [Thermoplasmatales archaeon]